VDVGLHVGPGLGEGIADELKHSVPGGLPRLHLGEQAQPEPIALFLNSTHSMLISSHAHSLMNLVIIS
jgi:hypothetical protein